MRPPARGPARGPGRRARTDLRDGHRPVSRVVDLFAEERHMSSRPGGSGHTVRSDGRSAERPGYLWPMAVIDDLGDGYALTPGQEGIARLVRTGLWDQVIDEVDGRRIRIGDRWLIDFASCNYLGLDLDPAIQAEIGAQVARWGVHPSWSRMLGSPRLYPLIEERMSDLLGVADTLLLPTISQIHLAVIPILARQGTILLDARAHRTVYDGCVFARGKGAT